MGSTPECRRPVVVNLEEGLHLRPLTLIVHKAQAFRSDVRLHLDGRSVDAKSMFDLMSLGAVQGTSLTLEAAGEDAYDAVESLAALFDSDFAELGGEAPRGNPTPSADDSRNSPNRNDR